MKKRYFRTVLLYKYPRQWAAYRITDRIYACGRSRSRVENVTELCVVDFRELAVKQPSAHTKLLLGDAYLNIQEVGVSCGPRPE